MADAVFTTRGAGIVGPMSNAASYQSLPEVVPTATQTAVNSLPMGISPEDMNRRCEEWTVDGEIPYVPLIHGFCFGITRQALDRLGGFDEEAFPDGYGEENDFCLRALECGFWPVIATHTFIYHSKSKSYTELRGDALAQQGKLAQYRRHDRKQFRQYLTLMEENPVLEKMRKHTKQLFGSLSEAGSPRS
jgi:GT2 family glycosyltransferase